MLNRALKVFGKLKDHGFRETLSIVGKTVRREVWRQENERFDRRYNVDTAGSIEPVDLQIKNNREFGVRYEQTPLKTFRRIMTNMPKDLSSFTFVDFGSGKGRILLLASHYPLQKIIGVEYAKDLHDIAERNIGAYRDRRQRCLDIECIHSDASVFPIPPGPCVLYFYQPFTKDVMVKVLSNIKRSLADKPRECYLVFLLPHPFTLEVIESMAFVKKMRTKPFAFDLAWQYEPELTNYSV